jgi:hypothetical protein
MAQQKNITKVIIETRLSQRLTHKNMILEIDPAAVIYEIDGQNNMPWQYYVTGILENKNWFIVNDLSFYHRFKKYFKDANEIDSSLKTSLLIDESFQVINNLATNNNALFKNVDLKAEFFDFLEKYVETYYATDLTKIEKLKKLISYNFENVPEFNIIKLKSKQTINKITLKNDMIFFLKKIYKNYLDGKKALAYFDTVKDLQTSYIWLSKQINNKNDMIQITGEHDNKIELQQLDEKKIVLTTSKIFNCISIDCYDDDETFIFTSNQKMINNYSKLNSAMRQRKSKYLNICIDKKGLFLTHNDCKKFEALIKHNAAYFNYIDSYNSMSMIDAIKSIINRGTNFEIENLIDDERHTIKKQVIVRLNGEKNGVKEKVLNLVKPDLKTKIEKYEEAKKNIDSIDEEVKQIIDDIKLENIDEKISYLTNNKQIDDIDRKELINKINVQEIINLKKNYVNKEIENVKIEIGKDKYEEYEYFAKKNNINMNTLNYEVKQNIIDEFIAATVDKNAVKLNSLLKKYNKEFLLFKDNEIVEKNLKRDYQIIFDETLKENYYCKNKTREILNKHKTDNKHKETIVIGYDILTNENREKTLVKNGSKYHLAIYDNYISLN